MVSRPTVTAALVAAAVGVARVDAHGYLLQPRAQFPQGIDITQFSSTIDSYALFPTGTFNTDPKINVASFIDNFKNSSYGSVREMILDNQVVVAATSTPECGFSDPTLKTYGALNDTIYFGRNDALTGEGFVHPGPCETWCDDNMVQQDMTCDTTYNPASGGDAPVPIDSSKCTDASRLTFYWIAMHGATWQVYIDCASINDKASAGTAPATTAAAPATTTAAPAATSAAPAPTTDEYADASAADEYDETDGASEAAETPAETAAAPAATTSAPAATTSAPAATAAAPAATEKCTASTRRRRRN